MSLARSCQASRRSFGATRRVFAGQWCTWHALCAEGQLEVSVNQRDCPGIAAVKAQPDAWDSEQA
jgi:hypothetical protein